MRTAVWTMTLLALACGSQPASPDGGADATASDGTTGLDAEAGGDAGDAGDAAPPYNGNIPPALWGHALNATGWPYGIAVRDDGHIVLALGSASYAQGTAHVLDLDANGTLLGSRAVCSIQVANSFAALGTGETFTATTLQGSIYTSLDYGRTAADGGLAFTKQLAGSSYVDFTGQITSVALEGDGNGYLAFHFAGSVGFDAGAISGTEALVKLDPSGAALWSRGWNGDETSVSMDGAGNLVLGTSTGTKTVDFGGGTLSGYVLADLAPDAGHVWSHNTPGATEVFALAPAPNGFVAILGASSSVDGISTAPLNNDLDIAGFDAQGNVTWAKRISIDSTFFNWPLLSAGRDGTFVFARNCEGGTIDFGTGKIAVGSSCCLADYSASGTLVWGGVLQYCGSGVATTDTNGDVLVAGFVQSGGYGHNLDLGGGVVLPNNTPTPTFIARLAHP